MAKGLRYTVVILVLLIVSGTIAQSEKLQSPQAEALLRIQSLLHFPSVLSSWNKKTRFCNLDPSPSVTVVCCGNNVTQLHIICLGETPKQPQNFSMDTLITTLAKLPSLKVLALVSLGLWGPLPGNVKLLSSLEVLNVSSNFLYGNVPSDISSLTNLQGLILDNNEFDGQIPDILGSFPALNVLSLRNNSLNGSLPRSLSELGGLRVLSIANNHFKGEVPNLRGLTNLEVLEMDNNSLGPEFPRLRNKLVTLVLRNNKFRSNIPEEISSYYQLKNLDVSSNKFMGPFPVSLLSLTSINYLNVAGNKFTGILNRSLSCSDRLNFVDISNNLLTGDLPECLEAKFKQHQTVRYSGNCLNVGEDNNQQQDEQQNQQHGYSFCRNEALAAGIVHLQKKRDRERNAILASCIVGGVIGVVGLFGLVYWVLRRVYNKKRLDAQPPRVITEKASAGYTSKLLADARYMSQTMKLGALGIPPYRTFSLEELEVATNNFNSSAFMGEGSHGQMYRGQLKDGTLVAIRCLKLKQSKSIEELKPHVDLISKLRHRHLVSSIGHCFECYLEDSSVSRLFLVFEYVSKGTLRSWISAGPARRRLTWSQRIVVSVGIGKGIHFLHTGIVPGIFSNNLRITDVLIDKNFAAKINSYNLPLLAESTEKVAHGTSTSSKEVWKSQRAEHEDKGDVYALGVILLEIIMGIQIKSMSELNIRRSQVQASLAADEAARRNVVAAEIQSTCSDQSLKTVMEVCIRCILKDPSERPSIEDVLWNLQFAAQVQDAWQGEDLQSQSSSRGSPASPPHLPRFRLTYV